MELLRGLAEIERTIVAIGSHDLVLDVAASALRAADPLLTLASSNVGLAGRAGRAARRAVPPGRLAPARPGHRRVHAAVPRPDLRRGRRAGRGPAGAPRPGSAGRPRQPAGADRHRRPHAARAALRQPPARRRHPGAARPRAGPAGRRPGRRQRLLPRGAHPPRRSPPRSPPAAPTPAWASRPPPARSGWTSSRSPASPTTWCCAPRAGRTPLLAPLWALLEQPDFRAEVEALGGYSCAETGRRIR